MKVTPRLDYLYADNNLDYQTDITLPQTPSHPTIIIQNKPNTYLGAIFTRTISPERRQNVSGSRPGSLLLLRSSYEDFDFSDCPAKPPRPLSHHSPHSPGSGPGCSDLCPGVFRVQYVSVWQETNDKQPVPSISALRDRTMRR